MTGKGTCATDKKAEQKDAAGTRYIPGTICGKRISEIDIWKKPGQKEPRSFYRERLSSSHADPTADTAIANVMREERMLRRRELMMRIGEERERRQILREKQKDDAKRQGEDTDA